MKRTAKSATRKQRLNIEGKAISSHWEQFHFGPYKRFPSVKDLTADFYLMQKYDANASHALGIIRNTLIGHMGEYHHEDEKIAELVNENLARVNVRRLARSLLACLWAGFSVAELVWRFEGVRWYLDDIIPRHPLSFFPRYSVRLQDQGIRLDSKTQRVAQLEQYPADMARDGNPVTLPIEKVVYWPLFSEAREEVYGRSLLYSARRPWYVKTTIEQFWNVYCEKGATPLVVVKVPPGTVEDPDTGQEVTNAEFYTKLITGAKPGTAVVIEGDMDTTVSVEALWPKGDPKAYPEAVKYWSGLVYLATLAPRLLSEEPEHGSRAQAGAMLEYFLMMLGGIQAEFNEVLVEQVAGPIVRYNFGEHMHPGTWISDPLESRDLEGLARIFRDIYTSLQAYPGTDPDGIRIRETFSELFPPGSEVEAWHKQQAGETA